MPDLTEADIAAMRAQGDIGAYIKQATAAAARRCADRVKLINRYPDLAARITEQLGHNRWNGYLPPEHDATGRRNPSPNRHVLLEILADAEQRSAASTQGAA